MMINIEYYKKISLLRESKKYTENTTTGRQNSDGLIYQNNSPCEKCSLQQECAIQRKACLGYRFYMNGKDLFNTSIKEKIQPGNFSKPYGEPTKKIFESIFGKDNA